MKQYIFITLLVMTTFSQTSSADSLDPGSVPQKLVQCYGFLSQAHDYSKKREILDISEIGGFEAAAGIVLKLIEQHTRLGIMSEREALTLIKEYSTSYKYTMDTILDKNDGKIALETGRECLAVIKAMEKGLAAINDNK
jgi:hypothetical protein|tara:strand:+ start:661 stop:1077 length:417 start_codon:yes stop_codon:yes gene_type:complete